VRGRGRWRPVRRTGNAVAAAAASAVVLAVCAGGAGRLPALGPALDPWHGAWAWAAGARAASQELRLPGLARPALVSFGPHGTATIDAASAGDAALALGYVHAAFRLEQMDLERRLAEGRLAQLAGPGAVASDEFELRLGLLRTARREWRLMPKASLAARMLAAYARGVNDYLARARAAGDWPAAFALAGVYPARWTPVDSLAVQGELTQRLGFGTAPLGDAVLARSLGVRRAAAWLSVIPAAGQRPWDAGRQAYRGVAPVATAMTVTAAPGGPAAGAGTPSSPGRRPGGRLVPLAGPPPAVAAAAASVLRAATALPPGLQPAPPGGGWAVNGPKAGGGALLAAAVQLPWTLPSPWYAVAVAAPGYDVAGLSVPGLPAVLIGHNPFISWSLAAAPVQSAVFYAERTSPARPGEYLWRGRWRPMARIRYTIPVRGGPPRALTVALTVHGPVLGHAPGGQAISVDWMGNVPSPDLAVLGAIGAATGFAGFRAALASWRAPAAEFTYADGHGNIGEVLAGDVPVVARGADWLPLPGTGCCDVAGVIPPGALPRAYDPAAHVIVAAGQPPAGAAYPYFLGAPAGADPGFAAGWELAALSRARRITPERAAAIQAGLTDGLAVRVVPRVLAALRRARLAPAEREAAGLLRRWDRAMSRGSAGAAIWWEFWSRYLAATFGPWWARARVPVRLDPAGLGISPSQGGLDEVLARWTLTDPSSPAFSPPGGPARPAGTVIRAAFAAAVGRLGAVLGGPPSAWAWARLHADEIAPLAPLALGLAGPGGPGRALAAQGYGPAPAGGDPWSADAADGTPASAAGPDLRLVVRWAGRARAGAGGGPGRALPVTALACFPGGQSENPASPWHADLLAGWRAGRYLRLPAAGAAADGPVRWDLRP